MDDYQNEAMPVGAAEVAAATQTLQRYKAGKAALDRRLVDNELWFRMGHWKNYQNPMMPGKAQPSSGWLFNSIANKHADAMDNYPEPNVLPRAADDEATARALSSVLPVVLEQADYEQVYSDCWWRKLKQGTGVTGVFWDPAARGGVGDIAVRAMNLLMLYWEPGVADIQDSPDFFSLSLEDTAQLTARYPQLAGHTAGVLDVPRYIHEDGADTASRSVVVDWYYKRPDESGRRVLHYCKFCNGVVLYASQNDPALAQRGLYDHGQYPFVFDPLFMEEDSPAGFGYIDVMKDCQTAIDQMNHAMDRPPALYRCSLTVVLLREPSPFITAYTVSSLEKLLLPAAKAGTAQLAARVRASAALAIRSDFFMADYSFSDFLALADSGTIHLRVVWRMIQSHRIRAAGRTTRMTAILISAPREISRQMLFSSSILLMAATPTVAAKKVRPLVRMDWLQCSRDCWAASFGVRPKARSSW